MRYLYHPIETVILAHGAEPSQALVDLILPQASQIVITDGALESYYHLTTREPDAVIGDGDSVSPELLREHRLTFTRIDEQMTNDLTKAVTYALREGWRRITILGGTGLREDHTIGNVFLLLDYLEMGAEVQMLSEEGIFIPFSGRLKVELPIGQEISLFAQDRQPMSARGVAYPFEKQIFPKLWQMTLNSVTKSPIELETEGVALLYIAQEKYTPRESITV